MFVCEEREKPEDPEKTLSEQRREPILLVLKAEQENSQLIKHVRLM